MAATEHLALLTALRVLLEVEQPENCVRRRRLADETTLADLLQARAANLTPSTEQPAASRMAALRERLQAKLTARAAAVSDGDQ